MRSGKSGRAPLRSTWFFAFVVALALPLLLLPDAWTAEAPKGEPVKIGWIAELSGTWSFFGATGLTAAQIAEEEINAKGGVLGRPIQVIPMDNRTDPAQAASAARMLDTQHKVLVLSGPTSSDTSLAIYGYAEQNQVPFVVPVAAFPRLTRPGTQWTFRVEPDAVGWGYAIVKFVEKMKPGASLALIYSDFALQRAIVAGIKYQAERSGVKIATDIIFPQNATDATVQAAQVKSRNPDFVMVSGGGAFDVTITNQLLDLGIKPEQIIHPFGAVKMILGWGPRSVGSYYGTFFDHSLGGLNDYAKGLISKFTQRKGYVPAYIENFCYATVYLIKEAVEKAGAVDRTKFRDTMRHINTKEITTGIPIVFDKNGARKEFMYFMQMKDVKKDIYQSKEAFYIEWDPEVIPVYQLAP
jgi:branched-chain amino acid transport system substrate-binding protein